nr:protoporphyrinogen oxidase [Metabacillus lacus]
MSKKIVIIGGGLTGLAAAYYLQKEKAEQNLSLDITLLEAGPKLGGKIQTVYRDGFIIERGPDSFLERKASAPNLAKELGLGSELVNNATGRSFVLVKGGLHPIPEGAVMGIPTKVKPFVANSMFSLTGKARAAADFVMPAKKVAGDQSLGHFFRRRLGNEVVENLIEPLLSGIYAGDIDQLSLMSTFPQFYEVEQKHGSLILGMKKSTPSSNQKHSVKKGIFQTFKSGLQTLVKTMEEHLTDTEIRKGIRVVSIQKEEHAYSLQLNNGESIAADSVIVTSPHLSVPAMFGEDPAFDYLKSMKATSVATVAMAFPKEAVSMDKEGTGFVVSRNSDYTITACTWTDKKWPHTAPEGKVLLRAYVGKAGEEAIVDQPDDVIVKAVLEDLQRIIHIEGEPDFYYVSRWKQAMPQYGLGHKERITEIKEAMTQQYPGVFLAGSSYEGIGLPDCIDQGIAAVKQTVFFLSKK